MKSVFNTKFDSWVRTDHSTVTIFRLQCPCLHQGIVCWQWNDASSGHCLLAMQWCLIWVLFVGSAMMPHLSQSVGAVLSHDLVISEYATPQMWSSSTGIGLVYNIWRGKKRALQHTPCGDCALVLVEEKILYCNCAPIEASCFKWSESQCIRLKIDNSLPENLPATSQLLSSISAMVC